MLLHKLRSFVSKQRVALYDLPKRLCTTRFRDTWEMQDMKCY